MQDLLAQRDDFADADALRKAYSKHDTKTPEGQRRMAEELLARAAELYSDPDRPRPAWFSSIITRLKVALNRLLPNLRLNEQDIINLLGAKSRHLLDQAGQFVENGERGESGALGEEAISSPEANGIPGDLEASKKPNDSPIIEGSPLKGLFGKQSPAYDQMMKSALQEFQTRPKLLNQLAQQAGFKNSGELKQAYAQNHDISTPEGQQGLAEELLAHTAELYSNANKKPAWFSKLVTHMTTDVNLLNQQRELDDRDIVNLMRLKNRNIVDQTGKSIESSKPSTLLTNLPFKADYAVNLDTGGAIALTQSGYSQNPKHLQASDVLDLKKMIGNQQLLITQTALREYTKALRKAGPMEWSNAKKLLHNLKVIEDNPSSLSQSVGTTGQISGPDLVILGTGDKLGIRTISGDDKLRRSLNERRPKGPLIAKNLYVHPPATI